MAQLLVRGIEEAIKEKIRQRALRHGLSLEEEVRSILRAAVARSKPTPKNLGTWIAEQFAVGLPNKIKEHKGHVAKPVLFK